MPPYASNYVMPRTDDGFDGPVCLFLGNGHESDMVEHKMDFEELVPDAEQVLFAVDRLRKLGTPGDDVDDGMGTSWWHDQSGEIDQSETVVVLDTNILLRHLKTLQDLVHFINNEMPSSALVVLVPHIVIAELDRLKTSDRQASDQDSRTRTSIATLARRATHWIFDNLAAPSLTPSAATMSALRGQRKDETLIARDSLGVQHVDNNDELVLDAALYHARVKQRKAVLLTEDKNLAVRAKVEQVAAFGLDNDSVEGLLTKLQPGLGINVTPYTRDTPASPVIDDFIRSRRKSSDATRRTKDVQAFLAGDAIDATPRSPSPTTRHSSLPISPGRNRPPAKPYELSSSRDNDSMMELEPDEPHAPLDEESGHVPPELVVVTQPKDVFVNASRVLVSFVAAKLYKIVFERLKETKRRQQYEWQRELGDWRWWNAERCVRVMRDYWEIGNVKSVCLDGLERQVSAAAATTTRTTRHDADETQTARRDSTTSRWAAPNSTTAQATNPTLTSERLTSDRPTTTGRSPSTRAPISSTIAQRSPTEKRLGKLYTSLTGLASSFATDPELTNAWSGPRWEVFLESIAETLIALLGGLFQGGVEDVVCAVSEEWAAQLRNLGLDVVLDPTALQ
ncbi:hypothetical protein ACM66B_000741 [Microbotryomycetes sp. NB124-2]